VPVFSGDVAVAAMALIYLRDALPQSQVDNVLVPRLREVSAKISRQYAGGRQ
jgi:DNA-binding IclR family transcriptional regulator